MFYKNIRIDLLFFWFVQISWSSKLLRAQVTSKVLMIKKTLPQTSKTMIRSEIALDN